MDKYLPWIAVALAPASLFVCLGFGPKRTEASSPFQALRRSWLPVLACLVFFAISLIAGLRYGRSLNGLFPASIGFGIGLLAIGLVHAAGEWLGHNEWTRTVSFAFATAGLATTHWFKVTDSIPDAQLGLAVGGMVAAFLFGIGRDETVRRSSMLATVILSLLVSADFLGREAGDGKLALTGVAFGAVAVLAAIAAGLVSSRGGKAPVETKGAAWVLPALLVLILGAWLLGYKFLFVKDLTAIFAVSAVVALVVHWLLPEDQENTTRFAVAAAIWLAGATAAYTLRRGYGMSVCLVAAGVMLSLLGNRKAMLSLAPLAALVLYRLFVETYPDVAFGPEIGPHYAMIGLLAGAVLPLVVTEWFESPQEAMSGRGVYAGFVLAALAVGVPLAGAVLYGPRGAAGFMIGLGFAPVVQGLRGSKSFSSFAIALGLAAAMTVSYFWLGDNADLAREQKTAILGRLLLDIVALSILVAVLSRNKRGLRSA